jgi:hypothetical protein
LYYWVDTFAGGLLVPEGIIRQVVSASALTWFIRYIYHILSIKPGIHDTSFASKSPSKFLEFKFFDRVYHTRNLNQKT